MPETAEHPDTLAEMAKDNVPLFTQKFRRAAAGVPRTVIADAAGVKAQTIRNLLSQGGVPRADVAAGIARACEVPLTWLLDDADTSFDPPAEQQELLASASSDAFLREGRRRYCVKACDLARLLKMEEQQDYPWARVAWYLLTPHDPGALPESVQHALKIHESLGALEYFARCFQSMFDETGGIVPHDVRRPDISATEIVPKNLLERTRNLRVEKPALVAIDQYRIAVMDWTASAKQERLEFLWNQLAPYYFARIIDDKHLADVPSRDQMRQRLRDLGYLRGAADTPVDLPGDLIWPDGGPLPAHVGESFSPARYLDDDLPDIDDDIDDKDGCSASEEGRSD